MIRFLLSEDAKTIHAENPLGECNIPLARAEGEKGTTLVSFSAAALLRWESAWRVCHHCVGVEGKDEPPPKDPKGE